MNDRLTELTVREMVERLATTHPVPGGGSASALAGAMGAALVKMVVALTTGRHGVRDPRDELGAIFTAATTWQSELLNLAELDANAYAAVVEAQRLPRGTELEQQTRRVQIAAATREATRAPLRTVTAAVAVLELTERLVPIGGQHAISDVGVAALLATTAARGGALNVRINLPRLNDEALRAEAEATLAEVLQGLDARLETVNAAVAERMA